MNLKNNSFLIIFFIYLFTTGNGYCSSFKDSQKDSLLISKNVKFVHYKIRRIFKSTEISELLKQIKKDHNFSKKSYLVTDYNFQIINNKVVGLFILEVYKVDGNIVEYPILKFEQEVFINFKLSKFRQKRIINKFKIKYNFYFEEVVLKDIFQEFEFGKTLNRATDPQ